MRNYKDAQPSLHSWLSEIFPIEAKLNATDILPASRVGLIELIRSGVTTFADMYFFPSQTARAVREAGMRACLGITLPGSLQDTKERFREFLPPLDQEASLAQGLIRVDASPHAIYTTHAESYQYARDFVEERGSFLHTHLSETKKEVDDCMQAHGKTPAFYLEGLGIFDVPTYLAHGVYLTDSEIMLLQEKKTAIVHNISSNLKLASGIAPIAKFMQKGLTIALGTDGASSNNNLNMLEEMHVATLVSRLFSDGHPPLPYDMVYAATMGGATALGLDRYIGSLEPGKDADIILIDTRSAHLTPLNDPFSALVYSTQSSDVDTVLCRGRILMQEKILQTIDEKEALTDMSRVWEDIRSRS